MSNIIEVFEDKNLLARYVPGNIAWNEGLSFFSNDDEFIQFGTWVYDEGRELLAHAHNRVDRTINITQEVLFVKQGSITAHIFNSKNEHVRDINVEENDLIVLLNGGHGYTISEKDTQVLEVKNGPYLGADLDRKRL